MSALPETVLQFGSGRFLRAFADAFFDQANRAGRNVGRVVMVQSTGAERADTLSRQGGRYHVLVRGLEDGRTVDRLEPVESISRALVADRQWDEVLRVARSPELHTVLSNTTEAGYALDPADRPDSAPPRSFPAKLLAVLRARYEAGAAPPRVLPCELIEGNADKLRGILVQMARGWALPAGLIDWVENRCGWSNTLVDRIVTMPPAGHPMNAQDAMLVVAEPFAMWAVQKREGFAPLLDQPAFIYTPDVEPYFLRKVRILNGAHTALAIRNRSRGFALVREAMADADMRGWLERLLFEEVVPVLKGRVEEPERFAHQTIERFQNPFLDHKFSDILSNHAAKVSIRLIPTRQEYEQKFGRKPPLLTEVLAAEGVA
jgi:tagaturonate reductase